MAPAGIRILTQRKPFHPFRIVTSDGTVYEVRHPDLVMIGISSVVIGVRSPQPAARSPQPAARNRVR